ncbi:MAG TPA: DUF6600 domain-containing protein [Terriglobia bacterium]|nr:DUF6600 domain-containing protein [Terriglobia bacterium]
MCSSSHLLNLGANMEMETARLRRIALQLILALLAGLLAVPLFANEGDPPARVARISDVQGNVSFQPSGESQWSQASLNYPVTTGDRLYADQGARAEIEAGPFSVHLSETTDLTLANLSDQIMQLGLGQGVLRVSVFALPNGNTAEVDTPNGALTVLSPGSYRVETYPNDGSTLVIVNRGSLQVTGGGANQRVDSGQAVKLTGTDPIQVQFVSPPGQDGFDEWCASRDRRVESYRHPQYFSPDVPGSEDLDAYGSWQMAPQYGPVWYPGGVPGGWVPYRYGRWAWVSPWGWTWVEDEPWGWAPFHYGRWAMIGPRWGWMPGPVAIMPVYAPAFVAFLGGSGFGIGLSIGTPVGWFPLGPRDPYFPWYHYGPTYLREVNITNIRNVTNITNIINVRNINSIHYAYQRTAVTAVPATVFRSGQPVARQMVRITPQQIARAQIIPHPFLNPTASATFAGKQVAAPPVRAVRFTRTAPVGRETASRAPSPAQYSRPPAAVQNSRPLARSSSSRPPLINRNAPPQRGATPAPRNNAPRFITRTPPPPRPVPFAARRQAMQEHPGRPLEPQQRANLRAGKPAGPMRDREFPPHPQPAPRGNSSPPAHPSKRQ